jgi:hypothetical protein
VVPVLFTAKEAEIVFESDVMVFPVVAVVRTTQNGTVEAVTTGIKT